MRTRRLAAVAFAPFLTALAPAAALSLATSAQAQSFGRALSFDLDDQVTCAGNFDLSNLTIETWINVHDYGPDGYGGVCAWGRQQDASYELGVFGLNGEPQILVTFNLNKTGYTAILQSGMFELDTWTHIAVTYDGEFVNFYRNGMFIDSRPLTVALQPAGEGGVFALGNLFTGNDQHSVLMMDDFRIWGRALTQEEIRCSMSRSLTSPEPFLKAYYTFDEASGQTVTDFSGNGRTGVLGLTNTEEINDPTRVESGVTAMCFDVVTQPASLTQCKGGTALLEFGVCGVEPLTYQWRHNGEDIDGANMAIYTITDLDDTETGTYECVVTNSCGTVTSVPAVISICPADFDCSGFADTDDFTAFVSAFEAGDDSADFDSSGFVDTDDFTAYVLAFEAGC